MALATRHSEYLSPEGLRGDGRRAAEVRRLRCRIGVLQEDGSAYVEQGNTTVIACISGPREARRRAGASHDKALLTCEFEALPFATGQFKQPGRTDRNSTEIASAVRRIFEPVIQVQLYPRTQIDIRLTLLQGDGGISAACINATTLALIDAGIAMQDFVTACSAGSIQGALLLDLTGQEAIGGAELCVGYLPRTQKLSFLQLEAKVPLTTLDEVMNFAVEGCRQIYEVLRDMVQMKMQEQLYTRGLINV